MQAGEGGKSPAVGPALPRKELRLLKGVGALSRVTCMKGTKEGEKASGTKAMDGKNHSCPLEIFLWLHMKNKIEER